MLGVFGHFGGSLADFGKFTASWRFPGSNLSAKNTAIVEDGSPKAVDVTILRLCWRKVAICMRPHGNRMVDLVSKLSV